VTLATPFALLPLPTRRSTVNLARRVAEPLSGGELVVLAGELGAGKTFFARALCRALDVPTAIRITSPTFSLVHEYDGRLPIRHSDLYRVREAREVDELGLADDRAQGAVLIVEWGVPFLERLGGDALLLEFRSLGDGSRLIRVSATGMRSHALAQAATNAPAP
jgi:tRNA threonylcarbamoyladenosine biosynthesis protein TsaE